jgi:hypothetical protein
MKNKLHDIVWINIGIPDLNSIVDLTKIYLTNNKLYETS